MCVQGGFMAPGIRGGGGIRVVIVYSDKGTTVCV